MPYLGIDTDAGRTNIGVNYRDTSGWIGSLGSFLGGLLGGGGGGGIDYGLGEYGKPDQYTNERDKQAARQYWFKRECEKWGWDPNFMPYEGGPDPQNAWSEQSADALAKLMGLERVGPVTPAMPTMPGPGDAAPPFRVSGFGNVTGMPSTPGLPTRPRTREPTPIGLPPVGQRDVMKGMPRVQRERDWPVGPKSIAGPTGELRHPSRDIRDGTASRGIGGEDAWWKRLLQGMKPGSDDFWKFVGGLSGGALEGFLKWYLTKDERAAREKYEGMYGENLDRYFDLIGGQIEDQKKFREQMEPLLTPAIGKLGTKLETERPPTKFNIKPWEKYGGPLLGRL